MKAIRIIPLLALVIFSVVPVYAQEGGIESLRQTGKAFARKVDHYPQRQAPNHHMSW